MRASISQSFPLSSGGAAYGPAVLVDDPGTGGIKRTTGKQIAIPLDVEPAPGQSWTLLGYGLSATILLSSYRIDEVPWARFGKLYAGITYSTGAQPVGDLPADVSLLSVAWDGLTDPTPPINPTKSDGLAFSRFVPQELPLQSGVQLCFGLWLTRSVVDSIALVIPRARCIVYYDTGA